MLNVLIAHKIIGNIRSQNNHVHWYNLLVNLPFITQMQLPSLQNIFKRFLFTARHPMNVSESGNSSSDSVETCHNILEGTTTNILCVISVALGIPLNIIIVFRIVTRRIKLSRYHCLVIIISLNDILVIFLRGSMHLCCYIFMVYNDLVNIAASESFRLQMFLLTMMSIYWKSMLRPFVFFISWLPLNYRQKILDGVLYMFAVLANVVILSGLGFALDIVYFVTREAWVSEIVFRGR